VVEQQSSSQAGCAFALLFCRSSALLFRWRMSLFGSIQMGGNTLRAMQIGLQVVGNNIANANTPGYVRQEAVFAPTPVQRIGRLILGTGVMVEDIVQKLDRFAQERLIGARGDRANAEAQAQIYRDLEVRLNALDGETDLSAALTDFFNTIHEVMSDPANMSTRNLAVGAGITLTANFNSLHSGVADLHGELNDRISLAADEINKLTESIRDINVRIASIEGAGTSVGKAAGLRVQRQEAIERLSELVDIHVEEQPSGTVSIAAGGELMVFEGQSRAVRVSTTVEDGVEINTIEFADTNSALSAMGGELNGLYAARDEIVDGFLDNLDELARTLAFEFNKLHSQGQGLTGFSELTSVETIEDANVAHDEAGLAFSPVSGSFEIVISNKTNPQLTQTTAISIDLNGLDEDTTLASLAAQLDAIDGLAASVTSSGALQLRAESADQEFSFSGDTSGVLAALGLNTFFTGSSASSLGVNAEVQGISNAGRLAASLDGIANDSGNAERLAAFLDLPIESAGNSTLADLYNQLFNGVAQGSSAAASLAEGLRAFEDTLQGQAQAVSGVSIDEEAIKMITLQRIYQASARYIQTVSELLELLVNL
jgi:flagellar hook-associated protein 1 FlgK